jgi:alpha-tubulin suppressor-like RCC1 family protein
VSATATFDSVVLNSPGRFTVTASDHGASGSGATSAALTFGTVLGAGNAGGCATSSVGLAYCWGGGFYGQLGGGSFVPNSTVPRLVDRSLTFTQLAVATLGHTCGVSTGGQAYCWGLNDEGQLGNGIAFGETVDTVPQLVVGGHTFSELAVGSRHTCGVTTTHELYCWGDDSRGELGSGKSVLNGVTATPTLVAGGLSWDHVSASGDGFLSSCGLTTTGDAYCWGANNYAQLGDNSTVDKSVPTAVVGGTTFTSIAVGATHSCAIAAADSTAYCWGTNGIGRAAIQIDSVAAPVDGGMRFLGIASGGDQSCGTRADHYVACWDNSFALTRPPTLDAAWGTPDAIAVGYYFDCRLIAGVVGCRGVNYEGQLGDGNYIDNFNAFSQTLRIQLLAPAPVRRRVGE